MPSHWCYFPSSKIGQVKSFIRTKGNDRGGRRAGRALAAFCGCAIGETRGSDLFSIDDELIGDYQDPQAITVTLHT